LVVSFSTFVQTNYAMSFPSTDAAVNVNTFNYEYLSLTHAHNNSPSTSICYLVYLLPKAFQLHDKNYDVWLANLRGSAYGRNHTRLNVSNVDFWNFSFHEQGLYDLPAIIDHVRSKSPFHQVLLIGHSQVCSI